MKTHALIFLLICFDSASLRSQGLVSIGGGFLNEHVTDPTIVQDGRPMHPGASIFVEFERRGKGAFRYHHAFELGYYHHRDFNQALFLRWKPTFSWTIGKLVGIHGLLGIGYAHSFPTREVYKFSDGGYESFKPGGLPHLMPSLGLGLSLRGDQLLDLPLEAFMHYEVFSLAPYSLKGEIPFTINALLSVGLKYRIKQLNPEHGT